MVTWYRPYGQYTCELRNVSLCSHLSLLSFTFQVQVLPLEGVSELSVAIRESLPLCPIQLATFLPLVISQIRHTPVLQPTVDACALVAFHERVDV